MGADGRAEGLEEVETIAFEGAEASGLHGLEINRLEVFSAAGELLFSCPTPVPAVHSKLKAAKDASW